MRRSLAERASLSAHDLFKGLPAAAVRALEQDSEVRNVPAGHTFFEPGESGSVLFFLEEGGVQTYRAYAGKRLIIAELQPPAVFGEMGCVGQRMYHCAAQTTKPSRIRTIAGDRLEALMESHPAFTRRLLDLVSQRFVRVLLDLDAASFHHLIPRVAALLLEKADGDCVRGLTHKEIAERLRVYRESVTAALGEMRKAQIIAVRRKRVRILDRARLERAARE